MTAMNTVRLDAPSKLNLTLSVTGKAGGYHMLDTLVLTVDLCDRIVARKRWDGKCTVTMHGCGSEAIPPETNTALRAAELFTAQFSSEGADITVYKNIPIGGGMGGSSADSAGVLRALAVLYGVKDFAALKSLADGLGSDTGYLLTGGFCRLTGRGEAVEQLGTFPHCAFLLLLPREGVSTAACFSHYREGPPHPRSEHFLRALREEGLAQAARWCGNDLYEAAKEIEPKVEEAYLATRSFSPCGAGMTGSGSGCFALFEEEELARWALSRYHGDCRACIVRPWEKKTRRSIFSVGEEWED